tara:strand:+ start:7729 stop:8478 length:750 start_codon:yes stop_codon:yes gene_type:complete
MKGISFTTQILARIMVEEIKLYHQKTGGFKVMEVPVGIKYQNLHEHFGIDKLQLELSDENCYNHVKSGYNSTTGEYMVYITLNKSNLTIDGLLHELKHAYVDWCIYNSGGRSIKDTREAKQLYTDDFEKLMSKDREKLPKLAEVVELYYFASKLEIPAFLENHFFDPNAAKYDEVAREMVNFEVEKYLDCEDEFLLLKEYDIPKIKHHKSLESFLNYSQYHLLNRGKYILKKIDKVNKLKEGLKKPEDK